MYSRVFDRILNIVFSERNESTTTLNANSNSESAIAIHISWVQFASYYIIKVHTYIYDVLYTSIAGILHSYHVIQ